MADGYKLKDSEPNIASQFAESDRLEELLVAAFHGDRKAAEKFFELSLSCNFTIPSRFQPKMPSNAAKYPNEFLDILGIQEPDRTVVPIFTTEERMADWSEHISEIRRIRGDKLFDLIPDGWWVCLNSGQEITKEFSPWEISKLRHGIAAIPEVVDDLFPRDAVETLDVIPLRMADQSQLTEELISAAKTREWIEKLFIAEEQGADLEGQPVTTILIGVIITSDDPQIIEAIMTDMRLTAEKALIGGAQVRVLSGRDTDSISLSLFKGLTPLYEQDRTETSVFGSISKAVSRIFRKS